MGSIIVVATQIHMIVVAIAYKSMSSMPAIHESLSLLLNNIHSAKRASYANVMSRSDMRCKRFLARRY